jgi:hypothetical protein
MLLSIRAVALKLTPAQLAELKRVKAEGTFSGSIPERRLANLGLIRVSMRAAGARAELTVQGEQQLKGQHEA